MKPLFGADPEYCAAQALARQLADLDAGGLVTFGAFSGIPFAMSPFRWSAYIPRMIAFSASPVACRASRGDFQSEVFAASAVSRHRSR